MKRLFFMGSSLDDLREFPIEARGVIGFALHLAQTGRKHVDAKPLKGFGGASVLEVAASHDGNTFRSIYTVRFADAVYVLHAFQKKSKRGAATPKQEIELVSKRLKQAEEHYAEWNR